MKTLITSILIFATLLLPYVALSNELETPEWFIATQSKHFVVLKNIISKDSVTVKTDGYHFDWTLVSTINFNKTVDGIYDPDDCLHQILLKGAAWLIGNRAKANETERFCEVYAIVSKVGLWEPGYLQRWASEGTRKSLLNYVSKVYRLNNVSFTAPQQPLSVQESVEYVKSQANNEETESEQSAEDDDSTVDYSELFAQQLDSTKKSLEVQNQIYLKHVTDSVNQANQRRNDSIASAKLTVPSVTPPCANCNVTTPGPSNLDLVVAWITILNIFLTLITTYIAIVQFNEGRQPSSGFQSLRFASFLLLIFTVSMHFYR